MITTIMKEFGVGWLLCRSIYSAKLFLLRKMPVMEKLFEHKVDIQRLDLCSDNTERIECFVRKLPEELKRDLLRTADLICSGTIKGFSSVPMSYGMPINWQLNPLTGKSCDITQKWYRIPDFDKERGDIKAVWEISRFSHFVTLARAYLVSGDKKYYEAFKKQLSAWLAENPYSYGANFKCGQECALRMMNALLAYNIFRSKGITGSEDEENLSELVSRCYRKILSNFFYAYRCIKNNHTISELAGIIIGSWCCGDGKRLRKAYLLLDKVITEQFSDDGGYTQYSFNYQRLALQILEYVLYISEKTGVSLSRGSIERIKHSVLLMYQCQDQTGDVPNYGFNDGALVFPVSASAYRDFRAVLGSLYGRLFGKRLYSDGVYDEEALWFGGNLDCLPQAEEPRKSAAFPDAGLFTLREDRFWLMTVLNDYKKRPAHMDQLHIDLWVDGINVLCDSGTYSYAHPKGEALALTGAHNTAKISNVEQMTKKGAFFLYDRTKRCSFRLSECEFYGEMQSQKGYIHKRHIKQWENGFSVFDTLTAERDSDFEIILHTPCSIRTDGCQLKLFWGDRHLLTVSGNLNYEIREGIRSVHYLSEAPVSLICFKGSLMSGKAKSDIKIDIITDGAEIV